MDRPPRSFCKVTEMALTKKEAKALKTLLKKKGAGKKPVTRAALLKRIKALEAKAADSWDDGEE